MLPHLCLFWEESDRSPTDRSAMEEPVLQWGSSFVKWQQVYQDLTFTTASFITFRIVWRQLVLDWASCLNKHHLTIHTYTIIHITFTSPRVFMPEGKHIVATSSITKYLRNLGTPFWHSEYLQKMRCLTFNRQPAEERVVEDRDAQEESWNSR